LPRRRAGIHARHKRRRHWGSEWQVIRSSNGYRLTDPLERQPGRQVYPAQLDPDEPAVG